MENIVALRVRLANGQRRYFLTWGRVFDPIDPTSLIDAVWKHLPKYQLPAKAVALDMCDSLQEAASQRYFFEAYLWFSHRPIPFGSRYAAWARATRLRILAGDDICYLGNPPMARGRSRNSLRKS
jgi:hypothetical protein